MTFPNKIIFIFYCHYSRQTSVYILTKEINPQKRGYAD